ncbi:uncharacterized protein AMSG_06048 [Thecamonas trahens ATCC 50062]|uniref:Uncharacterized protein n=1 Tax=Thecamonas trahens ATCC 50062 TaxID=461836 RepID=A0A0L0DBP9_THETB|nr:hypothetical protein AMSG_06048 [Thecamonas trahens ATCC 50062]KNC49769.1 hypothetical protein AMSG_06048 [Thecamonas trahens ATCC 50062]|eukprot:XP_013757553.1 hypothetical protein AMSG_06048 [Thecamonas trahens ATCC 50062]
MDVLDVGVDDLVARAVEEEEALLAAEAAAQAAPHPEPVPGAYGYIPESVAVATVVGAASGGVGRTGEAVLDAVLNLDDGAQVKAADIGITAETESDDGSGGGVESESRGGNGSRGEVAGLVKMQSMSLTATALVKAAERAHGLRVDDVSSAGEILAAVQELVAQYPPRYASALSNVKVGAFGIKRSEPLADALRKAARIIDDPQPITSVEAVYLVLLLTTNMQGVLRVPMVVVSRRKGERYVSSYLMLRHGGAYGLTGQSVVPEGSDSLFNLAFAHGDVPGLLTALLAIYNHLDHEVAAIHLGLPVPHDRGRRAPVQWKYLSLLLVREGVEVAMSRAHMYDAFLRNMESSLQLMWRKSMEEMERVDLINRGSYMLNAARRKPLRKRLARKCEGYRVIKVVKGLRASELDAELDDAASVTRSADEVHAIVKRLTSNHNRIRLNEHRRCECLDCVQYKPPARERFTIESATSPSATGGKPVAFGRDRGATLRLVTYNLLSAYNSHPDDFDYCSDEVFDWRYRAPRLLVEILGYDPDILCLQALDEAAFLDQFEPRLAEVGYDGLFRASGTGDGVAIFYRADVYSAVSAHAIALDTLAADKLVGLDRTDPAAKIYGKVAGMHHHNVALTVLLREKKLDMANQTDRIIAVSNVHLCPLYMDPEGADAARVVQTTQTTLFLEELDRILKHASTGTKLWDWPQIVVGDFSSYALDGPASLLKAQFPLAHPFPVADLPGIISHAQDLAETYGPFANAYHIFDHVFFSEHHFGLRSLLGLPLDPVFHAPLPNAAQCSDHIALVVDLGTISHRLISHQ